VCDGEKEEERERMGRTYGKGGEEVLGLVSERAGREGEEGR
jgi:hypothetical protein